MEIKKELVSAKSEVKKDTMYRHAYIYVASLFLLIAFGFLPLRFVPAAKVSLIEGIHGIFAMAWICLVVTQTWLIGHDNVRWHRRLGKSSFVLAPMLVITAFATLWTILAYGSAHGFPLKHGGPGLALAYLDSGLLIYFILFYVLAIVYRHDFRRHQRFMVCTAIVAIPPSLGRVLFRHVSSNMSFVMNSIYTGIFIEVILVLLMLNDWRKQKIYFAYWFSFVFFLIQIATIQLFTTWRPWLEFWRWLVG
ncbi:MAG TPA: hypothetical protein VKA08_17740 [Balneolales bacterium]|nr:hypothetical protein [Balneolales bacterium]